jgi:hypothetical protein
MSYVPKPEPKGKGMGINKYRGLCRQLIFDCAHPLLTPTRKHVLMALIDRINDKEDFTAWPAFNGLAAMAGTSRRTTIQAINLGRQLGLIQRVKKGGKKGLGGTSNRYRFCINVVSGERWKEVSGAAERGAANAPLRGGERGAANAPKRCSKQHERGAANAPNLSNDLSNDLSNGVDAAAASALRAVVGSVAASLTSSDNHLSEQAAAAAKRLSKEDGEGKELETMAAPSDNPKAPPRKQTPEEFRAEMRARGLDMSASRWGRGRHHGTAWATMPMPEAVEAPKVWSTPVIEEVLPEVAVWMPWTPEWQLAQDEKCMSEAQNATDRHT